MVEPLSSTLVNLLRELRLCTPGDLRRCRGRVRKLTRDLPAFDSVWLDALVQERKLTPFQATILESATPQRLKVGPCVLVNRLGGGIRGETYLARTLAGDQLCTLKLLQCESEYLPEVLARLQRLLHATADFTHPSLVVPHTCDLLGDQLVLVSRFVPGRHLTEYLIRRGRYPADVVWDIGRQLLDGLRVLAACGRVHGDIRCSNVRLTPQGMAVLVDAGVQPALEPELTAHSNLAPECYDGIAPELIGTGRARNEASELYAVGCLLWQLLAGRPPYPGGDPLGKLAAHQTRRIPDVREIAPETPAELATVIRAMTSREPAQRPPGAQAVLERWGAPRSATRQRLQRFVESFNSPVPRRANAGVNRTLPWTAVAVLLFAGFGAAMWMAEQGHLPRSLSLRHVTARLTGDAPPIPAETLAVPAASEDAAAAPLPTRLPLPAPDAEGLVLLDQAGPYDVSDISTVGALVIRGAPHVKPVVIADKQPLTIWATQFRLENVHLRANFDTPATGDRPPLGVLLRVQAQVVELRNCSIQTHADSGESPAGVSEKPVGVAWKMLDPRDASGGVLQAEDVMFTGRGPMLHLSGTARQISCRNVLKLGPGPLLHVATPTETRLDLLLKLEALTCRDSGPLVRWQAADDGATNLQVTVEADDCVFALRPQSPVFEFAGTVLPPAWAQRVRFIGEGSLAPPGLQVAAWFDATRRERQPLDASAVDFEGISTGDFEFAGPLSLRPADAEIRSSAAPRRSAVFPGIAPATLPGFE